MFRAALAAVLLICALCAKAQRIGDEYGTYEWKSTLIPNEEYSIYELSDKVNQLLYFANARAKMGDKQEAVNITLNAFVLGKHVSGIANEKAMHEALAGGYQFLRSVGVTDAVIKGRTDSLEQHIRGNSIRIGPRQSPSQIAPATAGGNFSNIEPRKTESSSKKLHPVTNGSEYRFEDANDEIPWRVFQPNSLLLEDRATSEAYRYLDGANANFARGERRSGIDKALVGIAIADYILPYTASVSLQETVTAMRSTLRQFDVPDSAIKARFDSLTAYIVRNNIAPPEALKLRREAAAKISADEAASRSRPASEPARSGKVSIGMTKAEVRENLGPPRDVTTMQSAVGLHEIWTYSSRVVQFENGRVWLVTTF